MKIRWDLRLPVASATNVRGESLTQEELSQDLTAHDRNKLRLRVELMVYAHLSDQLRVRLSGYTVRDVLQTMADFGNMHIDPETRHVRSFAYQRIAELTDSCTRKTLISKLERGHLKMRELLTEHSAVVDGCLQIDHRTEGYATLRFVRV